MLGNDIYPSPSADFDLPSMLYNRTGFLPRDRRHQINIFAVGQIDLTSHTYLKLGGRFFAYSGTPTNFLGAHERYAAGEAHLRPRGTGDRLPWLTRLDLELGFIVHRHHKTLEFTFEIYNVLNRRTVTSVDELYSLQQVSLPSNADAPKSPAQLRNLRDVNGNPIEQRTNFGGPTSYQSPLAATLAARFTF